MDFDFLKTDQFRISDSIEQTYNYEIIGDHQISVLIPGGSSKRLKKLILAAIKTEKLGYSSVDYIYKKFSNSWVFDDNRAEKLEIKNYLNILDYAKRTINEYLDLIHSLQNIDTLGQVIARSSLYRLQNTFKSILLLISRNYFLESINLCRVILEQCAWAYCIYSKTNDKDIVKVNPLDCIKKYKKFYTLAGRVNGFLSKRVHISPELIPDYVKINKSDVKITFNPKSYRLDSYICILQVTDMYCCTIEYIFKNLIDSFNFIQKNGNDYKPVEQRKFVVEAKKLLEKVTELHNNSKE